MIQILNFKILWTFCSIELLENFDIIEVQKVNMASWYYVFDNKSMKILCAPN